MNDVLFDTQIMVERLEGAGMPAAQARAHTAVLAEAFGALQVSVGILQMALIVGLVLKLT